MKNSVKRESIVAAAMELIAEYGFHGAPMSMIADRAGVGAGTIYLHFESKDALINEVLSGLERKILESLLQGYSLGHSLRERFIYLSTMIIRYFMAHPMHFRFIEQYMNSPYGVTLRRERLLGKAQENDLFMNLFQEGIAHRMLKDMPLPLHFALAFGPILSLLRDHILGFLVLDDELILKTAEACWDGIKINDEPMENRTSKKSKPPALQRGL